MGWASSYITKLAAGETVRFRPHGSSMQGKIESGQLVTVEPVKDANTLKPGDIVLCKVRGSEYLHLITAVRDKQFQISNNKNHVNGWTTARAIYGICTRVED